MNGISSRGKKLLHITKSTRLMTIIVVRRKLCDFPLQFNLLLKPDLLKKVFFSHAQFICRINFINKKVGNRKN